ncbi:hypothetical protein [Dethiobacter alkaliphilus]|uniref:Uncharacterized protein n=1 Tax=Dethiobacter alkaliphilus AHT 1 TaxID=555088 RepID=C0GEL1_DETAL|nr:hypothetical protein [Dethiobacter alkaliphilus]EEG78043.1 hypothetical protein DealDRAFT_0920 [Dethiobacter alkaliphilus AHT 1]
MQSPVWAHLLFAIIPEITLLVCLTVSLAGITLRVKPAIVTALLYAPILVAVREFFPPGIHTVSAIIIVPALVSFLYRFSYSRALKWFVVAILLLLLSESTVFLIAEHFVLPGAVTLSTGWHVALYALPSNLMLLAFVLILQKTTWIQQLQAVISEAVQKAS